MGGLVSGIGQFRIKSVSSDVYARDNNELNNHKEKLLLINRINEGLTY